MENTLETDLCSIQSALKSPKGRSNDFGGFRYRKAEDILEAVKPLLLPLGIAVTLSDEIVLISDWVFVKSTVTIRRGQASISCTAYARHAEECKRMDAAQVTGSASSYARKYALAGLFAINDGDDADDPPKAAPGVTPKALPAAGIHPAIPGSVPGPRPAALPGMKVR